MVQYQQPPPGQQQYPPQQYGGAPPPQYGHQQPPQYGHGYQPQGPPGQGQQPYYQNPYQAPPQQQGSYGNQVGRRKMQLPCFPCSVAKIPVAGLLYAGLLCGITSERQLAAWTLHLNWELAPLHASADPVECDLPTSKCMGGWGTRCSCLGMHE